MSLTALEIQGHEVGRDDLTGLSIRSSLGFNGLPVSRGK